MLSGSGSLRVTCSFSRCSGDSCLPRSTGSMHSCDGMRRSIRAFCGRAFINGRVLAINNSCVHSCLVSCRFTGGKDGRRCAISNFTRFS